MSWTKVFAVIRREYLERVRDNPALRARMAEAIGRLEAE